MPNYSLRQIHSKSPEETFSLGKHVGERLQGGEILGLVGDLGAGKTLFTKGIAEGLEVSEPIRSPSFVLVKSYSSRLALHHIDFYRLSAPEDYYSLGIDELIGSESVVVIEWADIFLTMLPESLMLIEFSYSSETSRIIKIPETLSEGF